MFILLASMLLSLSVACSGANPVIYRLHTQLQVYWNYPDDHTERLLVQILADDDDGYDEIYELYIIHDESELYWRVTQDEWEVLELEGNEWIILTNVVSSNNKNLPRGKYRIVILDFSGYRDEQSIFLNQENWHYDLNEFPILSYSQDGVYIPTLPNQAQTKNPLILELAYPVVSEDFAENVNTTEYSNEISFLGSDGVYFEITPYKPIKFVLNEKSRVRLYLHHFGNDNILYSSGPYSLQFNKR